MTNADLPNKATALRRVIGQLKSARTTCNWFQTPYGHESAARITEAIKILAHELIETEP